MLLLSIVRPAQHLVEDTVVECRKSQLLVPL